MSFDSALPALPIRPLGSTGFQASPLGLGTVKWGRTEGLKHGAFVLPEDHVLEELLDAALAAGINIIDTAPAYGVAEERIGRLLGTRRERFILCTKTGENFAGGESHWDFSPKHTRHSVEQSLTRLRTDVLDCVLLHCPRDDEAVLRSTPGMETLAALRDEGKIRKIGVSVMSTAGGLLALPISDIVMVAWNRGFHEHQPIIEEAARLGVGVLLKKVFYSGQLPSPEQTGGLSPAACALRSALSLPGNPVVTVGTVNPTHLRENIAAASQAAS